MKHRLCFQSKVHKVVWSCMYCKKKKPKTNKTCCRMKRKYMLYICRASLHRIKLNAVCIDWLESSCSINTLESCHGYQRCSENSHLFFNLFIHVLIYWEICQWSLAKTFLWGSLFWSAANPEKKKKKKKVSISRRLCPLFSRATSNSAGLILSMKYATAWDVRWVWGQLCVLCYLENNVILCFVRVLWPL